MRLLNGARPADHHGYIQALVEQAALGAEGYFRAAGIRRGEVLQQAHRFNAGMGIEAWVDVEGFDLDGGDAGQALGLAHYRLGLFAHLIEKLIEVVGRQIAHFKIQAAQVRHYVQGLAADDLPDMHGAVGHVVIRILRALLLQALLALAQRGDKITGDVNGVDRARRQGRVRFLAMAEGAVGTLALVAEDELHLGRFADEAQERPQRRQVQHVEQAAHTDAADFLVMRQRQLQRPAQRGVGGLEHGVDRQGDKAFHVAAAAAVDPPVLQRRLERRHAPGLAGGGHHVGVPGQQDPRHIARASAGEQIGLAPALVLDDQGLDAFAQQQLAYIFDQRQVRLRRDGVEGDQPFENLQNTGFHKALLRCMGEVANRRI